MCVTRVIAVTACLRADASPLSLRSAGIGVPNPQPPGHTLAFVPGYQTPDDASLATAWNISGPMLSEGLCRELVIDCNSDAACNGTVVGRSCKVYPNPRAPLQFPAVACPPLANVSSSSASNGTTPQPVLRVFYGQFCPLWQDNDYNCSWDNIKQSFNGGGCVGVGNSTQCMCRHLTDFAAARKPKIATCSASDMLSLSPGDIVRAPALTVVARMRVLTCVRFLKQVTKLKFLFAVVITLFGFMNVGAVIAFIMDVRERKSTLALLQQSEMGFEEHEDGAWTWTCEQREMRRAVEPPGGSAFHLATVFGIPFVRLRAALPEAMFAGSVGRALGRKAGLSVTGLQEARDENVAVLQQLRQSMSCFAPPRQRIPEFDAESDAASPKTPKPPGSPPSPVASGRKHRSRSKGKQARRSPRTSESERTARAECIVGTALAFAFMDNAKTLPVAELAHRKAAASAHLAGVRLPGIDRGFDELLDLFLVMLSAGNLSSRGDWLEKSRLWRLILLQRADGGFDLTESLAFALQAHEGGVPERPKPDSKIRQLIAAFLEDDDFDDVIEEALSDDESDKADDDKKPLSAEEQKEELKRQQQGHKQDCPLTFSGRAVRQRLPRALSGINTMRERRHKEAALAALERLQAAAAEAAAVEARRATAREESQARAVAAVIASQREVLHMRLQSMLQDAVGQFASPQQDEPSRAVASAAGSPPPEHAPALPSPLPPLVLPPASKPARAVPADRIWATVLAQSVLSEMDTAWLLSGEDEGPAPWRTVVDGAAEYLDAQGRADKRVRKLLKSGVLTDAAEHARRDWRRIQAANVAALRDADVINQYTALAHLQRASARVVRSVMTDHSTFATFLDTDGYIMRWQRLSAFPFRLLARPAWAHAPNRAVILLTLVLSTLLVSIWFYCASRQRCMQHARRACAHRLLPSPVDSRGANCCIEIRDILGCDPVGPCLGYEGDCGDLQTQFAELQGPWLYSVAVGEPPTEQMSLADYVCHAFPDDAYVTDQLLVGLISVAVALPVDLFLAGAFETANAGDAPESWLEEPSGKWKLIVGKQAHNGWRLADPKNPVSDLLLWCIRYGSYESLFGSMLRVIAWLRRRLRGRQPAEPEKEDEDEAASSDASGDARADAVMKRLYAAAGLLGVYVTWTIMSWCVTLRFNVAPSCLR